MWIEEFAIENIKCFDKLGFRLGTRSKAYPWVTLLGANGGGKSTVLQAMGLLLAGPEGAQKLLPRPQGWVRDLKKPGKITLNLHQGDNDPGTYGGELKERKQFRYTFHVTGEQPVELRNKMYTEPSIVEDTNPNLTWLRRNAFTATGKGWFGVGYGPFRRLTRSSQIIVPSLQSPTRFTNFLTQFQEDDALAAFEQWMVFLDYKIAKDKDNVARQQLDLGVSAINSMLPEGSSFHAVDSNGRILFDIDGTVVPTISLSDGHRSVLPLAGDLIWRILEAFPESKKPLEEDGVVLIDELDIHLHPTWQRNIPSWLRALFPNMQFIVSTHSPLIAAGAGLDAVTYRFRTENGMGKVDEVKNVAFWNVDRILESDAFGLVSPFSPQTQEKIDQYLRLKVKPTLTKQEERDMQLALPYVEEAYGGDLGKSELELEAERVLSAILGK